MGPAYTGAGRKWGQEGFLEEELLELSPKGHAEVNQADRKECTGRGNCTCRGLRRGRIRVCGTVQLQGVGLAGQQEGDQGPEGSGRAGGTSAGEGKGQV